MRLDLYLTKNGYTKSRDRAKDIIKEGYCWVNGEAVVKPSYNVSHGDEIVMKKNDFSYVSRGGLKLEAALKEYKINVGGKTALDVGCATGGFTDCLLQAGVGKVYALDVGKGQIEDKLQNDERVVCLLGQDVRDVKQDDFTEILDLIVVDVSFISVEAVLGALAKIGTKNKTDYVFLIKPQYEVGKKHKGVLKDSALIEEILAKVRGAFEKNGFKIRKEISSPILGKDGNREFLWRVRLK